MTDPETPIDPNLRKLAEGALDMWQQNLDALAASPKAKSDWAQFNQMMMPWLNQVGGLNQMGAGGAAQAQTPTGMPPFMTPFMANFAPATAPPTTPETTTASPPPAAPDHSAIIETLTQRVAMLEDQLMRA